MTRTLIMCLKDEKFGSKIIFFTHRRAYTKFTTISEVRTTPIFNRIGGSESWTVGYD